MRVLWQKVGLVAALWLMSLLAMAQHAYDPGATISTTANSLDLVVHDQRRARDIPLRIYLPAVATPAPIILFSHGLGGSREGNAFMGQHWSSHGYVVVMLQHAGSDDTVWLHAPRLQRKLALRKAASAENLILRAGDVSAVLDQLALWQRDIGHGLAGRLDLQRVGMSGHSFGALTTQAVSGQTYRRLGTNLREPRLRAAIAFSPSITERASPEDFANIHLPWLSMTGTLDTSPIGRADVAARRAVYTALPAGHKYELVLSGAEHSAFTERSLPSDKAPRNPAHHRTILAFSTAFWDAWLRDDKAALTWLHGNGARQVLSPDDQWQHN